MAPQLAHPPRFGRVGAVSVVAVAVGSLLGAGVFFLPKRVESLVGPVTPLAYALAAVVALATALGFAVFASSPLGSRPGGAYLHISRTWGSRPLGFLVGWVAVGSYVALLALLARGVGVTAAAVVTASGAGAVVAPSATLTTLATLAVIGVAFAVHLVPRVAGGVQVVLTGTLVLVLVGLVVPGLPAVVPGNFDPLLPTSVLREDPMGSVWRATLAATVGFLGLEAVGGVAGATRTPRETLPRALLAGVVAVGLLTTLAAVVVLGVIPWSRLVFAPVPLLDAAESYLRTSLDPVLTLGVPVATAGALVALAWAPSRLLAGMAEAVPPLSHTNRFGAPDLALVLTFGGAGVLIVADAVEFGLSLAPTGLVVLYATHALTAAALPFVRPSLYEACRFRPRPVVLVVTGVGAAGVMLALGAWTLTLDPGATFEYTRHAPTLSVLDLGRLFRDPMRTVVPALLGWGTAGVVVLIVARDYRLSLGVENDPLAAMYEER